MFKKLVHKVKGKVLSRYRHKRIGDKQSMAFNDAKSVLMLLDDGDRDICAQNALWIKDKTVTFLVINPHKTNHNVDEFGYCDISLRGKQQNQYVEDLLQQDYDVLLNFTRTKSALSIYLTQRANAIQKIALTDVANVDITITVSHHIPLKSQIEKIFKLLRDLKQY